MERRSSSFTMCWHCSSWAPPAATETITAALVTAAGKCPSTAAGARFSKEKNHASKLRTTSAPGQDPGPQPLAKVFTGEDAPPPQGAQQADSQEDQGETIYRHMSFLDKFSPEYLLDCLEILSEH